MQYISISKPHAQFRELLISMCIKRSCSTDCTWGSCVPCVCVYVCKHVCVHVSTLDKRLYFSAGTLYYTTHALHTRALEQPYSCPCAVLLRRQLAGEFSLPTALCYWSEDSSIM